MTPSPTHDRTPAGERAFGTVTPQRQLDCLLNGVGVASLDDTGWIRITGSDRVRWLNGMVTNSIQQLKPGQGNYSFALNAQGQIQGDLTAFVSDDETLLMETGLAQVPALMAIFDRFIIMDDVELHDLTGSYDRCGLLLAGPRAPDLLEWLGLPVASSTTPLSLRKVTWRDRMELEVVAAYSPVIPRFELWGSRSTCEAVRTDLIDGAEAFNGGPVEPEALEHLRLLEGTPKYGTDILPRHLAQETAQTRALHFSKGCYLGQEIVERIRSRGNVHRTLSAFRLEGPPPAPGAVLTAEGKLVGELTSVAALPLPGGTELHALGIIRREALERGGGLRYGEMANEGVATPIRRVLHEDRIADPVPASKM